MTKANTPVHFIILLFIPLFMFPATGTAATSAEINSALLNEITNYPEELLGQEWCNIQGSRQEQWTCSVYHNLGIHPLWVTTDGPTVQAEHIVSSLKNVSPDGLHSTDYGVAQLEALWASRTAIDLARLDIRITTGLLGYIHDMQAGRQAPKLKYPKLFAQAGHSAFDPVKAIFEARNNNDMAEYLSNLAPKHQHYRALKNELQHYRAIAENGGWPTIPTGVTLHPKTVDSRTPALRQLLHNMGDLTTITEPDQQMYDPDLVDATKRFQERHNLEVDGIIGRDTLKTLNISVQQRIQQILINMERWRWTKHDLGTRYVLVDIAGFTLSGVENDATQLEMRVIVGKRHHETPVFSDSIKYIEFHPFWNITTSIARNEMLGKLRKDNTYLASKHIKLFSSWQADGKELDPETMNWDEISRKQISRFKLRQEPGPWNALGVVKFVFPNKYSIYLHDTPVHSLFEQANRAFSHGCIRLSEPEQLADFLLQSNDTPWNTEKIHQVLEKNKRKIISLHPHIPVHLVYQTTWVAKDKTIHFSKDLYGRDKKLIEALFDGE